MRCIVDFRWCIIKFTVRIELSMNLFTSTQFDNETEICIIRSRATKPPITTLIANGPHNPPQWPILGRFPASDLYHNGPVCHNPQHTVADPATANTSRKKYIRGGKNFCQNREKCRLASMLSANLIQRLTTLTLQRNRETEMRFLD